MMNLGDYQSKTSTFYNNYSNAWNDNIGYTGDVAGNCQYWNDSVGYRGEEVDKYKRGTKEIFSESPNSFEHVDHCTSSITSLAHFQNQNVQTTNDCNQFEDRLYFGLQQNFIRNSVQLSGQGSLCKYSEQSHNTCLKNSFNYCNEFAKVNVLKNSDCVMPVCFDAQSSSGNEFKSAQRVRMQSFSCGENLPNIHGLSYEHSKSCISDINSEQEPDQSYNTNTFSPVYKDLINMQQNIRTIPMSKKTIPLGVDKPSFDTHPYQQISENESTASIFVDPYNHHWYGLGMGRMKMECWEMIVFRRNNSIYINTGLMSQSIGLSTLLVRRLIGNKAATERMTQLEVSILKYIKCLSATSHDTGLIPLAHFLNTLYAKLNDKKPNQAQIKSTIKSFIEKLHSGFVPAVSNIPYDLTSFFQFDHFNKTSIQGGSENSLKRFKVVSRLVLKEKTFSLIEYDGEFYMHLGEMVSNGLFPSINLVRRKIRKMHIQTKWLDSVESKYLNLSQEQELIRFSDLRILCGLILYLHPNMQTDLLQMFSAMDLPDHISTTNNHLGLIKNAQNCLPIENTARKKLPYQSMKPYSLSSTADNQKQFIPTESLPVTPVEHSQIAVNSASWMKNHQSVNTNVQIEMLGQNYDTDNEIRNKNHNTIMGKNVPSIPVREKPVLSEGRIVPPTSFLSEEPVFMDSAMNSKAKMDILDVAFKELLDGAVDICPISDIASSQILHRSNGSSKRDNSMTPETQDVCDLTCNKPEKGFDCYPTSISLSENVQVERGNDKLPNFVEQFLKSGLSFQNPEVFQKKSIFNNSIFDRESQMELSQCTDPTVNTIANLFPVSSNEFESPCIAEQSKPETFAGSGTNTSTVNRISKEQMDLQKCSQFSNTSESLDASNIHQYNAFKSKHSYFDKNQTEQLLANQSISIHSNILPPPATINAKTSEISTPLIVSNCNQSCNDQIRIPFLNTVPLDYEDKLLYTLPQITLPTLENEQNGARSFKELEKDTFSAQKNYPLTMPFSKNLYFPSSFSQSKISTDQDSTLQGELSPSITHCEIDSTNSLLSLSDGQLPTSNTPFQSLQINDLSSQLMFGSPEKSGNDPYKTGIPPGNKSLDYNKPTAPDCVSFQMQKSCSDNATISVSQSKAKSMLIFSENPAEKFPVVEDITSAKVTSCSETFTTQNLEQFVKYKTLPESGEVAFNSLAFKPGISLQKSQIYEQGTTCQPNIPCITSALIQRSYKEQTFEKIMDEKPEGSGDQKEPRLNPDTSSIQNHTLEIASMAAIDTLVMETNQDTFCHYKSKNVKPEDNYSLILPCFENAERGRESSISTLEANDFSEFEFNKSKHTSTDEFVQSNPAKEEPIKKSTDSNEQNSLSLISNTATTKQNNADSLFRTNNQHHKEISDTLCFDSDNYQYSDANHKQKAKMEPDVIESCIKFVGKEGQSVKPNSMRVEKLQCQKTLAQNEGNCSFSSDYQPMETNAMTHKSDCNMKCAAINKQEKQFNSCSEITSLGMGSMKYASSNMQTKAKKICEYNSSEAINLDTPFPIVSNQATTAKQISVLDLLNIKLYVTGNRLHMDVAITDQARKNFENKNKENPEKPEKIFLQQLANDCCQFAKYWFGVLNLQKNVCTNPGHQSDVPTRDRSIQMPSIFDSTIISCYCSKSLCGALKIPENETLKKHKTDFKEKISKTSGIFHNVIEGSPCESSQSNLLSFKKAKDCDSSSKFREIEYIEQMPQKRTQYCEAGFKSKSTKRKIPCPENELKKTKHHKTQQ